MAWAGMVHLTDKDRELAWACAETMIIRSMRKRDHKGEDDVNSHYYGALGEIAFAHWLGVPWHCHPDEGSVPDVAGYEVRTVGPATSPYVKTKDNDKADRIASVWLLAGCKSALIMGWIWCSEVRRLGVRKNPGNWPQGWAWFLYDFALLSTDFPEQPPFFVV